MVEARKMSAEEKKWQAESDARTLAEAEVIGSDKGRLSEAVKAAARLAADAMKRAEAMKKASNKGKEK